MCHVLSIVGLLRVLMVHSALLLLLLPAVDRRHLDSLRWAGRNNPARQHRQAQWTSLTKQQQQQQQQQQVALQKCSTAGLPCNHHKATAAAAAAAESILMATRSEWQQQQQHLSSRGSMNRMLLG